MTKKLGATFSSLEFAEWRGYAKKKKKIPNKSKREKILILRIRKKKK